nr:uncharacterized protein LOC112715909 isoform X1 [Arachis hypogaea]XP_029145528.1 uncharacterized protein LOC112715909 isoform X1 [Arachis hypogaea]XP_029145529.1 uncharacterized protein LOC112715909 isoform X1 [Arachis hypogaea]XP_029145530.1 uncharacterized protein LOC112715909 isoform X1 [Arachis hypogaea]XP_029145531.1 uncharacterized protein LOC112715909 isoform X1 [Arachis hypogaea]XP_029145532.1 uncharacterized protein LOC112715909 isoform X1 [Arachis hypogaea]XP_029145533.1 uncharac
MLNTSYCSSYLTCNLFGDFLTKMRLALMNAVSQLPIILLQSVKVKIYEEKVVVQNVIDCSKIMINPDIPEAVCFITRLNPSESYSIDSITFGNGFIVADVDDDFVNLSMNRSIKELRENDADGFFNVVAKIKSICNNFDWLYYSCVCGYLLEFFRSHFSCSECGRKIKNAVKKYKVLVNVEDATGSARFVLYDRSAALLFKKKLIEVLRNFDAEHSRLLPPTIFSPIYEDVIQNLQHHDEISSLGSRISVNSDNMKSIEVDMEALGAAYNLTKPNEEFHLDASDFLYKLIGKKLVFMFDPQPVESDTICPAYNVFKVSTHEFMLKLIERVKNRVLNACAIVSASNVASIQDPISHISGSVLPAHKSVRVVNEIICNKRLASLYRDVPRSTKQKLEDAFSRSIDRTWNDNEEASSSMNI